MTPLNEAIQKAQIANAQKTAAGIPRAQPLDAEELEHLAPWQRFNSLHGCRAIPADPRVVAAWVRSEKGSDRNKIIDGLSAISRLHDYHGLSNPCATS
jgi:hypothetical protein